MLFDNVVMKPNQPVLSVRKLSLHGKRLSRFQIRGSHRIIDNIVGLSSYLSRVSCCLETHLQSERKRTPTSPVGLRRQVSSNLGGQGIRCESKDRASSFHCGWSGQVERRLPPRKDGVRFSSCKHLAVCTPEKITPIAEVHPMTGFFR